MRRKPFWGQLLALAWTDLIFSLMHAVVYLVHWLGPNSTHAFYNSVKYWTIENAVDFASCILEVQIAAGLAVACSGSSRFTSTLRWALPLGFVAAAGLAVVWDQLRTLHQGGKGTGICFRQTSTLSSILWTTVVLSCCSLTAIFCSYSIVRTSAARGVIRRRGLVRGLSYVANALVTWVPYATMVKLNAAHTSLEAKLLARYVLFLNGAANVSIYVFWMWRSRRLQERLETEGRLRDYESCVLDTYFDVAGDHDAETTEAMRRAALAVAEARLVQELGRQP